jgi:hypothetical protein
MMMYNLEVIPIRRPELPPKQPSVVTDVKKGSSRQGTGRYSRLVFLVACSKWLALVEREDAGVDLSRPPRGLMTHLFAVRLEVQTSDPLRFGHLFQEVFQLSDAYGRSLSFSENLCGIW